MATELQALRARCRVLYDIAGSQVLTDPEWTDLINDEYRKLWRTVVRINKNFRVSVQTFTLVAGTQIAALPGAYRETRLVRSDPGTENARILDRVTERVGQSLFDRTYRLEGSNLVIEPLSRCAGNYEHRYIPNVTLLSAGDNELDAELDQFAAFIVYGAVNTALAREESERAFAEEYAREERDVIAWASSQRSADPDPIDDVRRQYRPGWPP